MHDRRTADFNESTYATFVTAELTQWLIANSDLVGLPIHPTIKDEADLGFDASIPTSWGMIYLQYKLSEFMRGHSAKEYRHIGSPYYRFTVKTDRTSNGQIQHNNLCALESAERDRNGMVCYLTPMFLDGDELLAHIRTNRIVDHSVYASPGHLGPVTEGSIHRYAFTGHHDVRPFSNPQPARSGSFRDALQGVQEQISATDPVPLPTYLADRADTLLSLSPVGDGSGQLSIVQEVAHSAARLGLQPVLLARRTTQA